MAGNMPNTERRVVSIGFDCIVRVGKNAAQAQSCQLAFVGSASYSENFQLMDCNVIGYMGPVTIDPQNYSCSITMDGFVPNKRVISAAQYEDGGKKTILDYIPSRQDYMSSDGIYKIPYMDFYNERSKTILASFTGVIFETSGMSLNANEYVRNNVTARALYKNKQ